MESALHRESVLDLSDGAFIEAWRKLPQDERNKLDDAERAEAFSRYQKLTPWVAQSISKMEERAHKMLDQPAAASRCWPAALDLAHLAAIEPDPPSEIMPGLPAGYATLLAGHGGAGKSALTLQLAVAVAAGLRDVWGIPIKRRGAIVTVMSCEDRADVNHWRLTRICDHLGINMAELNGKLRILDLVGHDTVLFSRDRLTGNRIAPAFAEFQTAVADSDLVIVDGVADVFGDNENDRAAVKQFVNLLLSALPTDAALLLVAHVNKTSAGGAPTSEGYSGSTGWHNAVRARWYLRPETRGDDDATGAMLLELQKANHGKSGLSVKFEWDDAARLFVGQSLAPENALDRDQRDREERVGILLSLKSCIALGVIVPTAMTGPRTAYQVLSLRTEFPESLRGGSAAKRKFWRHIEALRQMRAIVEEAYRRNNRHTASHFVITQEGCALCA